MAFVCIVFVIDTRHRRRRSNGSLELCHHMYAEERRQLICDALDRDGRVTVAELAERYDVVTETIRRDL
ncbi:MAG: DeoR family transcriptional regulator, partial [Propionibacterium sp.]|nr:DeoR family transcriptional regulator [Propionibacterium sp.]